MKPDETYRLANLHRCLKDIKKWIFHNLLMFNSDKLKSLCWALKNISDSLYTIVYLDGIAWMALPLSDFKSRLKVFVFDNAES